MRVVVSMRSVVPWLTACALGLSCAPAMEPVGYTPAHAQAAPPPPSASAPAAVWKHAQGVPALAKASARRFPSAGHLFGRYEADVLVNETGRASYASVGPAAAAPSGTLVVEVLTELGGGPGPVFAMEKTANGWVYTELDPRLRVQREGKLSPCVECHAHVVSQDELFGVPAAGR
jgi:hypothetical protein